ncbi:serine hydrolase domain-containing protein [Streptomyces sp. NPDC029674]|uniref:serine hydrolase domain-containing protein n=1 Tax=Streptomyces sp. NPDC029674 TaxID=3365297 RepID=UPI00384F4AB9
MPTQRSIPAILLAATLISLAAGRPQPAAPATDLTLPLLTTRGKAPAAALLSRAQPEPPPGARTLRHQATSASVRQSTARRAERPVLPHIHFARTGPSLSRSDHFRVGSITKTFIATVVLQLAAEHRLSLSDPVELHLPGLVRGPGVDGRSLTLRALLTHTSGLYDFTADTKGTAPVTPARAVRTALAHPAAPNGRWAYSNTNYVVLGMVIERVTGNSYATEAERRILAPLRLTGTLFPGARTSLPPPHGRAYTSDGRDVTSLDPRVAGAAGELISTLADLNRFYAALLSGRLLPPPLLRHMLNTRTAHGHYGMGLYPQRLPCGTTVWGHSGRITGSYVRTAATRDGRRVVTFRINTDKLADPGLERALLTAEFCPRAP